MTAATMRVPEREEPHRDPIFAVLAKIPEGPPLSATEAAVLAKNAAYLAAGGATRRHEDVIAKARARGEK